MRVMRTYDEEFERDCRVLTPVFAAFLKKHRAYKRYCANVAKYREHILLRCPNLIIPEWNPLHVSAIWKETIRLAFFVVDVVNDSFTIVWDWDKTSEGKQYWARIDKLWRDYVRAYSHTW